MIVLGLDSSADTVSVAVVRAGDAESAADCDPLAERAWRAPRPHAEGLLPALDATLRDAGVELSAVALIAVATGPGSFNGIRGGISVAQGLSLALSIPAIGIPTLDALSYTHAGRAESLYALLPAGRGEYYGAAYAGTWDRWQRRGDYLVAALDRHLDGLTPAVLLVGRLDATGAAAIAARGLATVPPCWTFGGARFVAALAAQRRREPGFDAEASLQAVYLRRPGITQPTRARGLGAIDTAEGTA